MEHIGATHEGSILLTTGGAEGAAPVEDGGSADAAAALSVATAVVRDAVEAALSMESQ